MEASYARKIRPGTEYDHSFSRPTFKDTSVKQSASVEDTMDLIRRTVHKTKWQTERIAQVLKGRDLETTCRNIWHFVYNHIQYKKDKDGVEQVRSPRRTWWERATGVDCDCYTEFISSILLNLNIPHVARITKYPKKPPETPMWQHVYPIVPRSGDVSSVLNRRDYIVIDCVKNEYDSEQPFLECKDYPMRLDYLDGFDDKPTEDEDDILDEYELDTIEATELAGMYGDDEELGSFLKKIAKKVTSTVKKVGDKVGAAAKTTVKAAGSAVKSTVKAAGTVVKKAADVVGDGIRLINRFANPVTILLRNGVLLAMKINLFNVAGRLRYAYLTDAQATALNMNIATLGKVRTVKDRAETIYWQAGGKKENLKKAILNGKGNKDKKVQLSGLFGFDDEYMDMDEYNIIHDNYGQVSGLGDPVSGGALAAATTALTALATALKGIKGLFNKGGQEEAAFQSETDNAGDASSLPASAGENIEMTEEQLIDQTYETYAPAPVVASSATSYQPVLPVATAASRIDSSSSLAPVSQSLPATAQDAQNAKDASSQGLVQKTTTWIKENKGTSLLIAGTMAVGGYVLVRTLMQDRKDKKQGLGSLPASNSRRKKKRRNKRSKIQTIKF